jgi:hypothetical protein
MKPYLAVCAVAFLSMHCGQQSGAADQGADKGAPQETEDANTAKDNKWVHFFSVSWGCVEVERAELDAMAYTIQDYRVSDGKCPDTLEVIEKTSEPLLTCPITIGPQAVPATYVLYDKRSLDGETVSDLESEGFTENNFCPAIAQRAFK